MQHTTQFYKIRINVGVIGNGEHAVTVNTNIVNVGVTGKVYCVGVDSKAVKLAVVAARPRSAVVLGKTLVNFINMILVVVDHVVNALVADIHKAILAAKIGIFAVVGEERCGRHVGSFFKHGISKVIRRNIIRHLSARTDLVAILENVVFACIKTGLHSEMDARVAQPCFPTFIISACILAEVDNVSQYFPDKPVCPSHRPANRLHKQSP